MIILVHDLQRAGWQDVKHLNKVIRSLNLIYRPQCPNTCNKYGFSKISQKSNRKTVKYLSFAADRAARVTKLTRENNGYLQLKLQNTEHIADNKYSQLLEKLIVHQ